MRHEVMVEAIKRYIIDENPEELIFSTKQLYDKYIGEGLTPREAVKRVKNENTLAQYEVYGILMHLGYNIGADGKQVVASGLTKRVSSERLGLEIPVEEEQKVTEQVIVLPVDKELDKMDERISRALEIIEKYKKLLNAMNELIDEVNHDRA